jgi:hypothetical protein
VKNPFPSREKILETKGALEEIRAYLNGWIDFDAVEAYLALNSSEDIARLAAHLRYRDTTGVSGSRDLVAAAAELFHEAEAYTEHQRLQMVSGMNRATLIELATRMGITDINDDSKAAADIHDWSNLSIHVSKRQLHRYDNVQRPVVGRLGDMDSKAQALADGILTVKNPAIYLESAASRTSLPHPSIGSTLENSLRWAVNEPRTSKNNLRAAFADCVRYSLAKQWSKSMSDLEEETGKDEALRIAHYVNNYEPGITVPDYIEFHAYGEIYNHWEPLFVTPGKLAWLSQVFHDFWEKHGKGYSKQSPAKDAKGLHTKRKAAGKKGATDRENRTYQMHSQNFVSFLGSRRIPDDGDTRRDLFTDFAREHLNLRTKDAQANIVDFLDILYVHQGEEPNDVLNWLHEHRLLQFKKRPNEKQKLIAKKMALHERSLLKRGHTPRTLLRGWSFDVDCIHRCLDILRPVYKPEGGPNSKR